MHIIWVILLQILFSIPYIGSHNLVSGLGNSASSNRHQESLTVIIYFQADGTALIQYIRKFPNADHLNQLCDVTESDPNILNSEIRLTSFNIVMDFEEDDDKYGGFSGLCPPGKYYNHEMQTCRELFCNLGYKLTSNGCTDDTLFNSINSNNQPLKLPDQIYIELTVKHNLCQLSRNETLKSCNHDLLIKNDQILFLSNFKSKLSQLLKVTETHLENMKIVSIGTTKEKISDNIFATKEIAKISLFLKNNKHFENETNMDTYSLYSKLIEYSIENRRLNIGDHQVLLTEVIEKTKLKQGWCNLFGDSIRTFTNEAVKIFAFFEADDEPTFFIYIPETGNLYEPGKFQLRLTETIILYNMTYKLYKANKIDNKYQINSIYWDFDNSKLLKYNNSMSKTIIKFYDLTKLIVKNDSLTLMSIQATVCDSIDIAGWVSLILIILSISFMLATLLTYGLFKELRNIPGWNIINLTCALIFAESSFLVGSIYGNNYTLTCFIVAILTHYGFLASFFWMNVIAFDLYRNFRGKSSHVLIRMIQIRERLPNYALFGWVIPFIIVLISFLTDLFMVDRTMFRPCYADFLNGCQAATKNSNLKLFEPKKGCWILNGSANLLFFGLPVALILIENGIFVILSIINIRTIKLKRNNSDLRCVSKMKRPVEAEIKFYIQMASIMGFTWVLGFFLTTFPANQIIINQLLKYIFIFSNASIGGFIFFVFIFRRKTFDLYKSLFKKQNNIHTSQNSK